MTITSDNTMANLRKHASAEDDDDVVAPQPKRLKQAKNTGGKSRFAPIDLESVASQRQNKATPSKTLVKKGTLSNLQRDGTPRPGGAPQAQQGKQRRKEGGARPADEVEEVDEDVTQTPAPPAAPPEPKTKFELLKPYPTMEQFQADDFPISADGNMHIILGEGEEQKMFVLHLARLMRPAPFFKNDAKIHEPGGALRIRGQVVDFTRMRRYVLVDGEEGQAPYLKQTAFTKEVFPKPIVAEEKEVENQESGQDAPADASKTPTMQNGNGIPAPNKPVSAWPDAGVNPALQNAAPAGPPANIVNGALNASQQGSAPASTPNSQTSSAANSSQASSAASGAGSGQNANAARSAQKMKFVKQENGVKLEPMDEDDRASSATPGPQPQLGIDLSTLPHIDGKPTIEMDGEIYFITAVDPADPQQRSPQKTINLSGLVYQLTIFSPAPPATPAAIIGQPQQEEEEEDAEIPESLPPNPCPPLTRADIIFGFTSVFSIIYNHPSLVSSTSIQHCLTQCESLIAAANSLGALRVVTAHIGNAIMNFGKAVYIAILQNPRRWLKLSVEIGHGAIFAEAVCHVVGAWPDAVSESYFSMLNKATVQLLEKKALELRLKIYEVNEKLFAASLEIGAEAKSLGRIELDKDNTQSFDTWLIVQLWRDWYSNQLSVARMPRTRQTIAKAPRDYIFLDTLTKLGGLFHVLHTGRDAYLAKAEIEKLLKAYRARQPKNDARMNGFLHFVDWENDLNRMKEFAKECVKVLMVNNSMLAPQEHGLLYFTCTKVEEGERPWECRAESEVDRLIPGKIDCGR